MNGLKPILCSSPPVFSVSLADWEEGSLCACAEVVNQLSYTYIFMQFSI